MKKIATTLTVVFLLSLFGLLLFFGQLEWSFSSMIIGGFQLFLGFIHSFSLAISSEGVLRTFILLLFGIQLILSIILLSHLFEIYQLWFWQTSIAFIACSVGVISTSVKHKVSPLVYYLQYMVLAIVVFSLLALGMTPLALKVVTIGFMVICAVSIYVLLFTKKKKDLDFMN